MPLTDYAGLALSNSPKRCRPQIPDSPDGRKFNIEIMHTRFRRLGHVLLRPSQPKT